MVLPSNRTKLAMLARNKWLSRCVLWSPGWEKIPGTTMVLIHQGAVRVEPEPVTAIQEGLQRPTVGHWTPITSTVASGMTRTRPLMATVLVEGPHHKATGSATIVAQTTDAPEPCYRPFIHTSSPSNSGQLRPHGMTAQGAQIYMQHTNKDFWVHSSRISCKCKVKLTFRLISLRCVQHSYSGHKVRLHFL